MPLREEGIHRIANPNPIGSLTAHVAAAVTRGEGRCEQNTGPIHARLLHLLTAVNGLEPPARSAAQHFPYGVRPETLRRRNTSAFSHGQDPKLSFRMKG